MENSQLYMTVKEAALLWGVREETVRNWCRTGKIVMFPEQDGPRRPWRIPRGAKRPETRAKRNGNAR